MTINLIFVTHTVKAVVSVQIILLPELDYVTFGSLLSVVCNVRAPQGVETFGNISSAFCTVAIRAKFYGDRPRGTHPSLALNA